MGDWCDRGLHYFLATILYVEYLDYRHPDSWNALAIVVLNYPASWIIQSSHDVFDFLPMESMIVFFAIIDALIGAVVFECVWAIYSICRE